MSSHLIPPKIPRWKLITLLAIIVFAVGMKLYNSWWPKADVYIGEAKVHVLVADTQQHLYQGWSKKKDMGKYGGMLFVFGERGQHTMVMRDMEFPLDIIWLDNGVVVDMAKNVQPEPDKAPGALTPYFASADSTHVLELPAGFADKNNLKKWDKVVIVR